MVTSSVFIVLSGYVGCDVTVVMVFLCLSVGMSGFGQAGFIMNHVDIAPQYASILMGMTNTAAALPGILSPSLTGVLTNQQSDFQTWRIVFFISAGVSVFGAIAFVLLGQGQVQQWALIVPKLADIQHGDGVESDDDCTDYVDETSKLLADNENHKESHYPYG